ncbi:MAG: ribosome maturation factor RimM [Bacteroidales bacterium]|jgi:16S rRNA processing protein RimM|nr:ribosome maturation factor RimM [Bacteroidales bacterium]
MNQREDFFYLGTITKPFGYKGQLFVYLDTDQPEKYLSLTSVFVEEDGEMIPYMIDQIQYRGSQVAVVCFRDLSVEDARALVKHDLFLPVSMLPPLSGNQFYFHEVIGFKVIDKEKGDIGTCAGFIEMPHQSIMQIACGDKEILVPAVDAYLKIVDREKRTLYVEAPEGLIDIYL